jgi:hypothetical protein
MRLCDTGREKLELGVLRQVGDRRLQVKPTGPTLQVAARHVVRQGKSNPVAPPASAGALLHESLPPLEVEGEPGDVHLPALHGLP